MISLGQKIWLNELKQLWQNTFGDSDAYLQAFFAEQYRDSNTLVYLVDAQPVAALYLVPYNLVQAGKQHTLYYFYALATAPEQRGRGYMGELITRALQVCEQRGVALACLQPSNREIMAYYRRFSFDQELALRQLSVQRRAHEQAHAQQTLVSSAIHLHEISAEALWQAYTQSLYFGPNAVQHTRAQNDFYLRTVRLEEGQALGFDLIQEAGQVPQVSRPQLLAEQGYLIYSCQGSELLIHESNVGAQQWPALAHSLFRREAEVERITLRQPLFLAPDRQQRSTLMLKKFQDIDLSSTVVNRFLE